MSKFLDGVVLSEQESTQTPASGTLALVAREGGLYYLNSEGDLVGPLSAGIPTGPTPPPSPDIDDLWVDTSGDVIPNSFSTTFGGTF